MRVTVQASGDFSYLAAPPPVFSTIVVYIRTAHFVFGVNRDPIPRVPIPVQPPRGERWDPDHATEAATQAVRECEAMVALELAGVVKVIFPYLAASFRIFIWIL